MCENCSKKFSKILLIIVNILFLIGGLIMLGFGIAAFVVPDKILAFFFDVSVNDNSLNQVIKAIGVFGIVLGSVVVVVAFFGFVGAVSESLCLLGMYLFLIVLIILAQIALIITAALIPIPELTNNSTLIDNFYKNDIQTDVFDKIVLPNGSKMPPWSYLQLKFKCCGIDGKKNYQAAQNKTILYKNIIYYSEVPLSCCQGNYSEPTFIAKDINSCVTGGTTNQPCKDTLKSYITSANTVLIGIAAGIIGLELLVLIFASILIHNLRQEKNVV